MGKGRVDEKWLREYQQRTGCKAQEMGSRKKGQRKSDFEIMEERFEKLGVSALEAGEKAEAASELMKERFQEGGAANAEQVFTTSAGGPFPSIISNERIDE